MEQTIDLTWNLSAEHTLRAGADGAAALRWLPVFGASGYRLYRTPSDLAPDTPLATVEDPAFTDTGLTPDTVYHYRIVPLRDQAASEPPPPPDSLSATATGPASAALSWPLIPEAQGYVVYRGRAPEGPLERVATVRQNTYADAGLTSAATYYYRVAAYGPAGIGATSPLAAATTLAVPAPGHVTAQAAGPCGIQLHWSPVPGAAGYRISRGDGPEGPFSPVATVPGTAYRDTALDPSTSYSYQVAALAAGGPGADSVAVTAETFPVAPSPAAGLRARALSCRSIAVSWAPIPGAERYILSRSVLPEGPFTQVAVTEGTLYPDGPLLPGTTYYYRVSAVSGGFPGPASPTVSAATLAGCQIGP